ncbi:MAG: murein transglycosylase A [Nitrospirae bacterium]|nr:murein transglycosylase A [Nitrospirota bacterium]
MLRRSQWIKPGGLAGCFKLSARVAVVLGLTLISLRCAPYRGGSPAVQPSLSGVRLPAMIKLEASRYPFIYDDLDAASLKEAIKRDINYLDSLKEPKIFRYGEDSYTVEEVKTSLLDFIALMDKYDNDPGGMDEAIRARYNLYVSSGTNGSEDVLFTGYYVPNLRGSLTMGDKYRYPLYGLPADRITVDLGNFIDTLKGRHIVGRLAGDKLVPYYTNEEITRGALKGRGLELLWVDDPVDLFFLQIQGSGVIELAGGDEMYVSYAGSNGHSYKSIGSLLVSEGKIPLQLVSMQRIKAYLREHPGELERVLFTNPSFVFFRKCDAVAISASGVPLVDGRAIATDLSVFPQGALAYVNTSRVDVDQAGNVLGLLPLSRYVINQDTGGAIRGSGRADFFWGRGQYAETQAGVMHAHGDLYFLIEKKH